MLNLSFDSAIFDTTADDNGEGTGFATVQANTKGDQYDKSRINLDPAAGTLTLTATKGSSNATTNTLKNALQVGVDATKTFTVSTRISSPITNLKQAVQQGGLFIGSDQDNYAKLVVVQTGSGGLAIQLYKEENGSPLSVGLVKNLDWANIKTLDLYLTGDPITKTITAAYRVNSNTTAPTSFLQSFKPSSQSAASFFGSTTKTDAGILAFTSSAADVPITFNYFGIAQDVKIDFQLDSASTATGYIKDSGKGYSATRGYGWVKSGTNTPLDMSEGARDRNRSGVDQKLDTLLHMQYNGNSAAWEYSLPNGTYSVAVSVGDQPDKPSLYTSKNAIRVEGVTAIKSFQGTANKEYYLATAKVTVTDGRLTIDAVGGTNTKINYLEITNITPGKHPEVTTSSFSRDSTGLAYRDTAVNVDVKLPTLGKGVATPLNTTNVQLYNTKSGLVIEGEVNTSGGGDAIVYQPSKPLDANTNYTFKVTNAVRDEAGATFIPYSMTFNTGSQTKYQTNSSVKFTKSLVYGGVDSGGPAISSLLINPDGTKLYAAGLDGKLRRWNINSDGTLSGLETFTVKGAIVGLAFDPKDANVLWISRNDPLFPRPAKDFTGKISKITLKSSSTFDATIQDYVTHLPRSGKDHLTNSITFGADGMLYVSQGSNSSTGARNAGWYDRDEQLLSASILQIDPRRATGTPIDVQTKDTTPTTPKYEYDPYKADAPVKIYAAGIRNAYDLVWHTNNYLYAPTNGSAPGGNTADDPATSVNEKLTNVGIGNDYLFKIAKHNVDDRNAIPYYGHTNPAQGNYILNGGNPTSGVDRAEVVAAGEYAGYAVGIKQDPNYKGFAYDFGRNRSPNGAIEYKSSKFNNALKNKLLVVEYSGGDDILALEPGSDGNIPSGKVTKVFSGLDNPLDLIENTKNGNLYVAELKERGEVYSGQITLLKA